MNNVALMSVKPESYYQLMGAIGAAMAAFPKLPRTATGIIGNGRKFNYAPYHKVVECIKPALNAAGVTFVHMLHSEREGYMCMTLVVSGHGAAINSTIEFPHAKSVKDFGADVTYYKRYQLSAFFGLDGDPDADDYEEEKSEVKYIARASSDKPSDDYDIQAGNGGMTPSEFYKAIHEEASKFVLPEGVKINDLLTSAMKQLDWKMEDLNKFAEENKSEFQQFNTCSKMIHEDKVTLMGLLVEQKKVAPF